MYESYYGLSDKPFRLRPDPHFFFGSKGHKRAMAYLEYGLSQGEGFIVITGEVGAGKTTLVRNMLSTLEAQHIVAAHLVNTPPESGRRVAHGGVGVRPAGRRRHQERVAEPPGNLPAHLRRPGQARAAGGRRGAKTCRRARSKSCACCRTSRPTINRCCKPSCWGQPGVPHHAAQPGHAAITPARHRHLSPGTDGCGGNPGLYRTPPAHGRLDRQPVVYASRPCRDLRIFGRHPAHDQSPVRPPDADGLSGRNCRNSRTSMSTR